MRLTTGLATTAAGFATLAAASSGAVYEIKHRPTSIPKHTVSLADARLGIEHIIGATQNHQLGALTLQDPKIQLLESLSTDERGSLFHKEIGRLVFSLAGVGLEDVDGLELGEALMTLKESPNTSAAGKLVKTLSVEKTDVMGTVSHEIYSLDSSFCVATKDVRDAEKKVSSFKFKNYKSWQAGQVDKGVTKEMLQVYSNDRLEDRHFVSEYLLFKGFVERVLQDLKDAEGSAFCHSQAMEGLISAYGQDSTEVILALSLYRSIFKSPTLADALIMVTPPTMPSSISWEMLDIRPAPPLQKRAPREAPLSIETPSEPTPGFITESDKPKQPDTPLVRKPLGHNALTRCHAKEDTCKTNTNGCSDHGECIEATKGCWTCVCKAEVVKTTDGGKRTTNWAGAACSKKDISVPFNLFLIFTVGIVLVVAMAIGMLISVDSEPLPSVLSAGVAPNKRA